ncbi:MAG: molecular chaperone DnaJ [Chloroflexota bacterium]|nr:molecular chaperone DnaJ [Chloroflexota bacterium]MDE2946657.1 molecular chaperone DnaJ [Chloroflexota bacterium]
MPRDYYEVLGVSRGADEREIKSAFRRLARQYHPDVSSEADAEAKFKEINEAYEVLSDEDKRARYDRFGHAGVNGAGSGFSGGFGGFEDIFDIFNSAFGEQPRGRRRGPSAGRDRRVDVTIDFVDAVFGVEKEIEFQRLESCDSCGGTGAAEGARPSTCGACNGSGEVRQVQQTFLGSMVRAQTCPNCGGTGQLIRNPCRNCDGSGRRQKRAVLSVKIPAGVSEGIQIQVRGDGDAGERGAPSGNLFVVVHVRDHEYFKRNDNNILLDIGINIAQATLGDRISVDTVDGPVELQIPAGTQTGKVFRLRGKGIPRLRSDGSNSGRGDQLVSVQVETPTDLSEQQRALFVQLAETLGQENKPRTGGRGLWSKMADFLSGDDD